MDGAGRLRDLPLKDARRRRSGPGTVRAASRVRAEHPRTRSSLGQAAVELAVALPLLVALAVLVLAGGKALATSVALTDAARAGAVAAASAVARGQPDQAVADAVQAATSEGLALSCSGAGVPPGCVAVAATTGSSSGEQMEVVTVYDQVDTGLPALGTVQIHAQAAATP